MIVAPLIDSGVSNNCFQFFNWGCGCKKRGIPFSALFHVIAEAEALKPPLSNKLCLTSVDCTVVEQSEYREFIVLYVCKNLKKNGRKFNTMKKGGRATHFIFDYKKNYWPKLVKPWWFLFFRGPATEKIISGTEIMQHTCYKCNMKLRTRFFPFSLFTFPLFLHPHPVVFFKKYCQKKCINS